LGHAASSHTDWTACVVGECAADHTCKYNCAALIYWFTLHSSTSAAHWYRISLCVGKRWQDSGVCSSGLQGNGRALCALSIRLWWRPSKHPAHLPTRTYLKGCAHCHWIIIPDSGRLEGLERRLWGLVYWDWSCSESVMEPCRN
jgi:hypothetical protein